MCSGLLIPYFSGQRTQGQLQSQQAQQFDKYCRVSPQAAKEKETLRLSANKGNKEAKARYQQLVKQDAQSLQDCRGVNWPQVQAIWLRLYPCDTQPGAIDKIMDKIANRGYNQVYLEVFYDGKVLLPSVDNPTAWPSVIRNPRARNIDLLSKAIQKGRERGLKVYAWMFTQNFGLSYAKRQDRDGAIARNGKGQSSLYVLNDASGVFIDPYNEQARRDYSVMVREILRRNPDGLLFDYVRYPRQTGMNSIATRVTDLWLYSDATQQALFRRAKNNQGLDLIRRFLDRGYVTKTDITQVAKLYPHESEPMWSGRSTYFQQTFGAKLSGKNRLLTPAKIQPQLQNELWLLSVAHAMQGILDFVAIASLPAQELGLSTGAVFFPEGNEVIGKGYDSRLQPWDKFPSSMEWHPMAYADCGNTKCITAQVQRVLSMAKPGTQVIPVIAGTWGKSISSRLPLEQQMRSLEKLAPQIQGVSHFAFSWQFPEHDGERKFCKE
ncbi:MAG: family 10 glycosylhydrolase [Calothrix sp. SM1_7_51]|nr:family 10 glycosylhydrolase [Calothrix sp. SM1_7_51]